MALQDIVSVQISLETAVVSQKGFGVPLFIGAHNRFSDRVRGYTSIKAVAEDFEATDDEYLAAQAAFSQNPSPAVVKIGRRVATTILTPENVADGTNYSISITVNDGDNIIATYTAGAADDAETVATSLVASINGNANVADHVAASVVGASESATVELVAKTVSDYFYIAGEQNLAITNTSTETAGDVLAAIRDDDDDFYFVTAHDHTEPFVLAMAAAVEAMSKIYFVSVAEEGAYSTLQDPAEDILGKLKDGNYFRTSGWYHHEADTKFPEMAFVSVAAPATPGTKVWGNNRVAGFGVSRGTDGKSLSYTERNNLNERNANWLVSVAGNVVTRTGKVAANEWIDIIRDRDFYEARLTEAFQAKFISSPKVSFTQSGINELRSVFNSTSDRLVSTAGRPNVLEENNPYVGYFPDAVDVPVVDKQNRVLNATFTAYLAGAIQVMKLEGGLTYQGQ